MRPQIDSLVITEETKTSKLVDKSHINNDNNDEPMSSNTYSYKFNEIVWRNVILLSILHILAIYAWFVFIYCSEIKWQTAVATFLFGIFSSSLGITAGAHRLWSHRSYKAKWPLR